MARRSTIRNPRLSAIAPLLLAGLLVAGCRDEKPVVVTPYDTQTSEDNVLKKFESTYKGHLADQYAQLLANDFRFYFDAGTAERVNLEFWDRTQDSTATSLSILTSEEIGDIRIHLTYNPVAQTVPDIGRERWTTMTVDAWLEVDQKPTQYYPEGVTLRVDHQQQLFYFRKGRTEADTLAASSTSELYFLVEWRDQGTGFGFNADRGAASGENTTWSGIKSMYQR